MDLTALLLKIFALGSYFLLNSFVIKFGYNAHCHWAQKNQTKICKHAKCRNLRYYNVSRDENPHKDNELDYSSFDGFHAQLDYKITNVPKKCGETLVGTNIVI